MKTLKDVVEMIVNSMNMPNFSAYDITGLIRHHVEWAKSREKFDIALSPPNSQHWYNIKHEDVRAIIVDMYKSGKLTRKPNGDYYTYNIATPLVPTPKIVSVPTKQVKMVANKSTSNNLADLVYNFVLRKSPAIVSLKQIQSALKRHGNFTCKEISEIKQPLLRLFVNPSLSKSYFQ